ncbi:MAG: allophanate hydrolase [Caulobacteraceae bacterium]
MNSDRLSALEIAAAVRGGQRSAVAVAEESLARAKAYDDVQPQTWIARLADADVLARARRVDERLKAGEDLPLAGVPFAVKDNLDLAGVATTAGCPAFAFTPAEDAVVVARLVGAGAVPIGKTNLDQFATGLVGARSPYGACACVFDRQYIAGGSSSGSAVATAAGLVAFALGSDTAGSGRVPAAFNGLVGFKPTRGRWSTRGLVPACRSLDCVSVLATSLADAALIDEVLTAFDERDPYSRARAEPGMSQSASRLGVPRPGQLDWCGDGQSAALFDAARGRAARAGGDLIEVDIAPFLECARMLYQGPWVAERAAAMAGILRDRPGAIHPVVRAILQAGANVSAVEAFEGFHALKTYERAAQALWAEVDALLLPTAPTICRIAEVLAEPFALNANLGIYTNFVNLLDMAAISVPAGFRDNGTGFGVSFIGPAWSEARLMRLAGAFERTQAQQRPPLDLTARPRTVKLAVVGAHLAGMPLHWQLTSRGARFVRAGRTEAAYRLYAMTGSSPPKPALVHAEGGAAIEVEIYELELAPFGAFTAEVAPPLAIGTVTLEGGESVKGFVAEPRAILGAEDITHLGGWRRYVERH